MGVQPSADANIVKLTNEVESVVNQLNETTLKTDAILINDYMARRYRLPLSLLLIDAEPF